jgi:hypothetical protein
VILYRERVLPSAGNIALPVLLFPSAFAVLLPIYAPMALPVASISTLALATVIFLSSPTTVVDEEYLIAKKARISRNLLGPASIIPKEKAFEELGPKLDSRAWLSLQASVKGLVRVEINDPNDPTPYWLISTRNPELLVKALNG